MSYHPTTITPEGKRTLHTFANPASSSDERTLCGAGITGVVSFLKPTDTYCPDCDNAAATR